MYNYSGNHLSEHQALVNRKFYGGFGNVFLDNFVRWTWIVLIVCAALQCGFWPEWTTVFAVSVVLLTWKIITTFILTPAVIREFPLSAFMVLGLSLCQYVFPIIFTLLELRPITYNLEYPYHVFTHSIIVICVVTMAHCLYRQLLTRYSLVYRKVQKGLVKLGAFQTPDNRQLWMMGIFGLLAMFYIYFYSPSVNSDATGAGNKFVQGFIPYTYAPFYIFIARLYGKKGNSGSSMFWLAIFTIALFTVSIGRNSRGAFMFGFTGVAFAYFLGLLLGFFSSKIITRKNLLIAGLAFWALTGPLADLGTAMVIVRGERSNVDRVELLKLTLEKFGDKEAIASRKEYSTEQKFTGWDERYLDNIFLARFCNLKFNDESLTMAQILGEPDPYLAKYAIERPLATFPQPIIDFLGMEIDKERVNSASSGDVLFDRVGGKNALGGFRVGHFSGFGMASVGWWYLFFLFILIIPVFFLWDILFIKVHTPKGVVLVFSMIVLLELTEIFRYFTFENVFYIIQFLIRGWVQLIFMYLLLFYLTRFVINILGKKQ